MGFGVQRLVILAEACEPLLTVGNVQTSIQSTLQSTKNPVASSGPDETDIEQSPEWPNFFRIFKLQDWLSLQKASNHLMYTSAQFLKLDTISDTKYATSRAGVLQKNIPPLQKDPIPSTVQNLELYSKKNGIWYYAQVKGQ